MSPGVFRWANLDSGEEWAITQDACDSGTFYVGEDCKYLHDEEDPYKITFIELNDTGVEGLYGPGYELLRKLELPDSVAKLISKNAQK